MALGFQAKLPRILEDQRIRRVGSNRWVRINVRVIAATNKNLAREVAANRFRADLYYRLNVLSLQMPPLRERREDIPLLVRHFLSLDPGRPQDVEWEALLRYAWPGNVRELKNTVRRMQWLADGSRIALRDLPPEVRGEGSAGPATALSVPPPQRKDLEALTRRHVLQVLDSVQGHKSRAAALLGISRHRLYRLLQRYGPGSGFDGPDP